MLNPPQTINACSAKLSVLIAITPPHDVFVSELNVVVVSNVITSTGALQTVYHQRIESEFCRGGIRIMHHKRSPITRSTDSSRSQVVFILIALIGPFGHFVPWRTPAEGMLRKQAVFDDLGTGYSTTEK